MFLKTHMKKIVFLLITLSALRPLYGDKISTTFEGTSVEELNKLVTSALEKLNEDYEPPNELFGFEYRYQNGHFGGVPYDIYLSTYKNGSLLRIESLDATSRALTDIIRQESGEGPFAHTYQKQDYILGYTLTIVTPFLGHYYTNIGSPLTNTGSWLVPLAWLATDGLLLWMGGTNMFQDSNFDPFGQHLTPTLILLGLHRAFHLYPIHMRITLHNNMVGVGYTFRY